MIQEGLLVLLFLAAVSDIRTSRISNRLVLAGLGMGILFRLWEEGPIGVFTFFIHVTVPIIVLFILFLMRVLGAGDIKLFSVISGICGFREWIGCVAAAFIIGAILAVVRMIYQRNFSMRILCLGIYIRTILTERSFFPYPFGAKEQENTIHFSIAILIGYLVNLGVCH